MRLTPFSRALALVFVGLSAWGLQAAAQTPQEPSIADAARRNREEKKAPAKPGTVITNDTLSPTVSAPASTTTAPAQTAQSPNPSAPPLPGTESAAPGAEPKSTLTAEETEKLKTEISNMKQQVKEKQNEVDLLKRLLDLDREALYSKPDYSHDSDGKAKLNSEQEELTLKEEEFAKLKAKLLSIAPRALDAPAPAKP